MITTELKKKENKIDSYNYRKQADNSKSIIIFLSAILFALTIMFVILAVKLGRIGYRNGDLKEVNNSGINMANIINISEEDLGEGKTSSLGIFKTNKNTGEKTIAPNSKGTYKFCIQNVTDDNIKYDINFSDAMTHKINMKYRLKIDNVYIKGDQNNFVDISELNIKDINVLKNSNNIFTLEWMWDDENDELDTKAGIGEEKSYYTINLKVSATRIGV